MTAPRRPATVIAGARVDADPAYGSVTPPLWSSDTFRWEDGATKPHYDYARTVNPNRDLLLNALAELELAAGGAITSSGQSATLLALLLVPAAGLIVAPHDCYGGTYRLIQGLEAQGRLRALFVDMADDHAFARAMERGPALVWIESPSNPLLRITDIRARARAAREAGALVAADNTLLTPLRQKPLALGCDLVMHSTTKALNGHSDLFGGALLARDPALVERIQWWANAAGLNGSAFDAWQTLRGLRTLELRLARQEQSALVVADWLNRRADVLGVNFPGLEAHAEYDLGRRQQDGPGFMVSFRLAGGGDETAAFLAGLRLITLASSLGGYSTLICQPATMTHRGMPDEAQAEAGIHRNLLRLSIGIEDVDDLVADLAAGFDAIGAAAPAQKDAPE